MSSRTSTFRTLASTALAASAMFGLALVSAAPAHAAANWTVYRTHFSPKGHDIPLRYGRHDNTDGKPVGFGVYHIDDRGHRHTMPWSRFDSDIQDTLDDATCQNPEGEKWECVSKSKVNATYGKMKVVYTHADGHTPDGRAGGIITAYYLGGGCLLANEASAEDC
ncbi:hypothetical protein ACIRLA_36535 [Streptomyces sp. NPDC102364]|uniref:hypothetical protein n=1 Tax=unclassified Streptomyces TaxID=2593676 RepID=UPI00382DAACF